LALFWGFLGAVMHKIKIMKKERGPDGCM